MADQPAPTDAIALLKQEHREVLEAFEQFEAARDDGRKAKLAKQICTDLTIHAMLEEEIFYPALRGKIEDDKLDEAYVEHDSAKVLISQIDAGAPGEEFWDSKVKVLGEEIEHHIEEEEKPGEGIFHDARETGVDLVEMCSRMLDRKQVLKAKFEAEGLPAPEVRTMKSEPDLELGREQGADDASQRTTAPR